MSYARPQGDYATGGYGRPQGDWGSIWTGVKEVGKALLGGAIGGWLGTGGQQTTPMTPPMQFPQPQAGPPGYGGPPISFPGMGYFPTQVRVPGQGRLPPFTATGAGVKPFGGMSGGMIPSGWHLDKQTGTKLVRNRRMNIANPRALRRAMRRVQGFEKLAKRTISFTRRVRMKKRKSS